MIRAATATDAATLARLFALLGHRLDPADIAARIGDAPTLVAERDGAVVAALGLAFAHPIHRRAPIARLTILVVDEAHRGQGLGRAMVDEAVERARARGCELVEVTSNERLAEAHAFYRAIGFVPTSRRFALSLQALG